MGMTVPPNVLDLATRPSRTSKQESEGLDPGERLGRWRKVLGEEKCTRILRVVERCGGELYGTDSMPLIRYNDIE